MGRGDVWWADLDPPMGSRPVVLLSRNRAYTTRALITIAPVTTRIRNIRAEVPLGPEDGLAKVCVANLDTIQTIHKSRLRQFISSLSPEKLMAIDEALKFALGLLEQ